MRTILAVRQLPGGNVRGDPELHDDGSITVESSDPAGLRYEVRVRDMDHVHGNGGAWLNSGNRRRGLVGRLVHSLLRPPQLPPGMEWFLAAARPLEGASGELIGTTYIKARSITEALTQAVDALESGSFPRPGEPTYLS